MRVQEIHPVPLPQVAYVVILLIYIALESLFCRHKNFGIMVDY